MMGVGGVFGPVRGSVSYLPNSGDLFDPSHVVDLRVRRSGASIAEVYRAIPRLLTQRRLVLLLVAALSYLTVFVGLYAALQLAGSVGGSGELLQLDQRAPGDCGVPPPAQPTACPCSGSHTFAR